MVTATAGSVTTIRVNADSTYTITPGTGGSARVWCNAPVGTTDPADRRIYAATSISVPGGGTLFIEAIGVDATYTWTASGDLSSSQVSAGAVGVAGVTSAGRQIDIYGREINAIPASYNLGTLWANWDNAPATTVNASRISDGSDASPDPDAPLNVVKLPWASGNGSIYDHVPSVAYSFSGVDTLGFWLRANPRADGGLYTVVKVLFSDSAVGFTNFGNCTISVRADGRWHLHTMSTYLITQGGGTWSTSLSVARIRIREGDGGTITNRSQMTAAADAFYLGAIRANTKQRPMAFIRFDDGLPSLYSSKTISVGSLFTGTSGISVPAGSYSMYEIVSLFGFKANCFILTDYIDTSGFETKSSLQALYAAGWDICYQGAANPISNLGAGARLLGPLGYTQHAPGALSAVNTTTGVITTTAADCNVVNVTGQPFPVTAVGTDLPPELTAGTKYYLSRVSSNTFTVHTSASGSWDGVTGKVIPSSSGTLANWGFRYYDSANDHTAILADIQRGTQWLTDNGMPRGARHYALNQGAWDSYVETAVNAFGGFDTVMPITLNQGLLASGISASCPVFESSHYHAVPADTSSQIFHTLHAPWINITDVVATDSAGSGFGSSALRAWVQQSVKRGQVFSNYHHSQSLTTNLDLLYYLDELKLWSNRGMLDVFTMTEAWDRISAARSRIAA